MTDTTLAIADLRSRWFKLVDLDRAQEIEFIHRLGVNLCELATALNCSPSLLTHLLQAARASIEDRELARRRVLSTRALVQRAKADGARSTAMNHEEIAFARERTALQGSKSILNWIEEGFSIEAQVKLLRAAALKEGLEIAHEFIEVESAKAAGRKEFNEMVNYFKRNRSCRILLVEKTDRLYRNFRDAVTLEELDIKIYFVKENEWLSKDSKSQAKLMHDIRLAIARNYTENQREEVIKGMTEKASEGTYPGRAPFGYRNNVATRTIEIHPEKSAIAQRAFELYASGNYSLVSLSKELMRVTGTKISKTNLHKMFLNSFYIGFFNLRGQKYKGTQPIFINLFPGLIPRRLRRSLDG